MYERTYHAKVLTQKAPPEKKRRKRFPLRRVLWGILVAMLVALAVVLIRLPQLQVQEVEVRGTHVVDPEDVSLFIRSKIEGNYLGIFPRRSMLLVPTSSLGKWTARQFPRFAAVDVRRRGLDGLLITVAEHDGVYLWCGEGDRCFFMNAAGLVFAPAPYFSGDAYPRIYIGREAALPFSPLVPAELAMVQLLLERLPLVGIEPSAFRLVSPHQLAVEFSHRTGTATLLLDPGTDLPQALEHLATALLTDPLRGKFNSALELAYIDARFSNRIVYKFIE